MSFPSVSIYYIVKVLLFMETHAMVEQNKKWAKMLLASNADSSSKYRNTEVQVAAWMLEDFPQNITLIQITG